MLLSAVLITGILILGTLAIALILPKSDIQIADGIIQAFQKFFSVLGVQSIVPVLALIICIGQAAGVNTWIIGPSKDLKKIKWRTSCNINTSSYYGKYTFFYYLLST